MFGQQSAATLDIGHFRICDSVPTAVNARQVHTQGMPSYLTGRDVALAWMFIE